MIDTLHVVFSLIVLFLFESVIFSSSRAEAYDHIHYYCRLCTAAMDGAFTHSAFDELDFGTERHSTNIPVDVNLPLFEVLPCRC